MKKITLIVLVLLNASALYGKLNVVVSIIPQETFVKKIGGDRVNVTTMVKPGSDPHTYEPKPLQMIAISKADIYFSMRIDFEKAWLKRFTEQNKKMELIEMTKGVEFIDMPSHGNMVDENSATKLPYEWAGVFNLSVGNYTWSFDKLEGKYANQKMKFLMLHAKNKNEDLIESYEDEAKNIFEAHSRVAKQGDYIDSNKKLYELNFDESKNQTLFNIFIREEGSYIFFTEHMPFEFENKEHFFKDIANNDVEPITSHPETGGHGHHHAHQHHDEFDPHTWLSPLRVKIMANNIYTVLSNKDPKNKAYYLKNYEAFIAEINTTDAKIKKIFSNTPKKTKFMVFHPSWGYFANEYDLVQLAIEVEGKEPKPKMLAKIIDKAKEENIKAIFTQQEFSDKSAKVIAGELGIKVIKETPLAAKWSQNLLRMANTIANN